MAYLFFVFFKIALFRNSKWLYVFVVCFRVSSSCIQVPCAFSFMLFAWLFALIAQPERAKVRLSLFLMLFLLLLRGGTRDLLLHLLLLLFFSRPLLLRFL